MMNTPICDFVRAYRDSQPMRLHMPGHKGQAVVGPEALDITEVDGADVLYSANGIIRQSEENASSLFGSGCTYYSAEGSSLCIRAMLYLVKLHAKKTGRRPLIAAARNAHKVFMTAAALMEMEIRWLFPAEPGSVVACRLNLDDVERVLAEEKPAALYVTSPDYLGNMADLPALSRLCRAHGTLLVVDNAHGAYLKFLPVSRHPLDLGADMCCDSAHKTLPVLTGGAYLHVSRTAPELLRTHAENALSLFASTSPSYLILQSLDNANRVLAENFSSRMQDTICALEKAKEKLREFGYAIPGDEPLKLTLGTKVIGWRGDEVSEWLLKQGVNAEFADPDFLVMMFTPAVSNADIEQVTALLCSIGKKAPITEKPPRLASPVQRMRPHDALFSTNESIPVSRALGRVLASASVTCPPAVPIVTCGEVIDETAIACFQYYGITHCYAVEE